MNKKRMIVGGIALGAFILFNAFWFVWREIAFSKYAFDGMEKTERSSIIAPRYYYVDKDGYSWFVKFPDYLSFVGNITVMIPTVMDSEDVNFDNTLIIWPHFSGKYEYGMFIYEDDSVIQIYIDNQGDAIDSTADEIIERHKGDVVVLLQKANEQWDIP